MPQQQQQRHFEDQLAAPPKPLPLSLLTAVFHRPSKGYWKPPPVPLECEEEGHSGDECEAFQLPAYLDKAARRREAAAMEEYRRRRETKCWNRFLTTALILLTALSIFGAIATFATYRIERKEAGGPSFSSKDVPETLVSPEAFSFSPSQQAWLDRQLDPYSEYSNTLPPEVHSRIIEETFDARMMNVDVHAACRRKIFDMSCRTFDVVLAMAIYEFNVRFSCKYVVTYKHLRRLDPPGIEYSDDWRPPLGYLDFYTSTPEESKRARWEQLRIFGLFGSKMTVTNGSMLNRPLIVDAPLSMIVFRYGYAYPMLKNTSFLYYSAPFSENVEMVGCTERNVTNYLLHTAVRHDDEYYKKLHELILYGILVNNARRLREKRGFPMFNRVDGYYAENEPESAEDICRTYLLDREVRRFRLRPWRVSSKSVTYSGVSCESSSVYPIDSTKAHNISAQDANENILMRFLNLHFARVRKNVLHPGRNMYEPHKRAAYMFADYVEREKANITYLYEYLKLKYKGDNRIRTVQELRSWLPLNSLNPPNDSDTHPWRPYLGTPIMREIHTTSPANFDRYFQDAGITSKLPPGELRRNEPGVVIPIVGSKVRHLLAILKFGVCKFVQDETTINTRRWANVSFAYDAPPARYELSDGTVIEHDRRMRYTVTHPKDDAVEPNPLVTADLDELAIHVCALEYVRSDVFDYDQRRPNAEYTDRSPFDRNY